MTLLSDPPSRTPTPRRARSRPPALLHPVTAAIDRLDEVGGGATLRARRRIDQMLREALDRHPAGADDAHAAAVPAVRVACAHLAAGDLEDAYLALLTARDKLR